MEQAQTQVPLAPPGRLPRHRWLLALPFAYGVLAGLFGIVWSLATGGQRPLPLLASVPFWLVPVFAYATAALLLFDARPHRLLWALLLLFALAHAALEFVHYAQLHVLLLPLYLAAVAVVRLHASSARVQTEPGERDAVQL